MCKEIVENIGKINPDAKQTVEMYRACLAAQPSPKGIFAGDVERIFCAADEEVNFEDFLARIEEEEGDDFWDTFDDDEVYLSMIALIFYLMKFHILTFNALHSMNAPFELPAGQIFNFTSNPDTEFYFLISSELQYKDILTSIIY